METKAENGAGRPERTVLVVEGDGAEALRSELAARGFSVAVLRGETAEKAAVLQAGPASAAPSGGPGAGFSEESLRILFGNLTPSEIKALLLLLRNAGTYVSKRDVYCELYQGAGPVTSRAPDQILRRMREKLGRLGACIECRRGVGVRWNPRREETAGITVERIVGWLPPVRAAALSLLLIAGIAAGWLFVRSGTPRTGAGRPAPPAQTESIAPLILPVEATVLKRERPAAPGHGPECAVDGKTNTWFQTGGPTRKRDGILVRYRPAVRGTLSVRCDVPGGAGALPEIRVAAIFEDNEERLLGTVDPETGLLSCDLGEKPVRKVLVAAFSDSDEPFAVRSVVIVEP